MVMPSVLLRSIGNGGCDMPRLQLHERTTVYIEPHRLALSLLQGETPPTRQTKWLVKAARSTVRFLLILAVMVGLTLLSSNNR